jgi:uncharacterized protein (TIGR04255 family)
MGLELPEPSTERLEGAPLSLVVCQIRHEQNLAVADPRSALSVHQLVADEYPILEEQSGQELTIAAGPGGVQALPSTPTRGWRMRSKDAAWTAVVMPDNFALETTTYVDWPDFVSRFERLLAAIAQSAKPSVEQRVGFRMINRITHPRVNDLAGWAGLIDPAFLGPIMHLGIGASTTASQQILQVEAGEGRSVLIRHGCFVDSDSGGQSTYILDNDCFNQRGRSFDESAAREEIEHLHRLALQIFQAEVTPVLYEHLRANR